MILLMKTTVIAPHRSSLGMDANLISLVIFIVMAVVSWFPYLGWFAWVVPIIFFMTEKESSFVKFQSATALIIGLISAAIKFAFWVLIKITTPNPLRNLNDLYRYATGGWGIHVFFGGLNTIIGLAITAVIIYMIIMAYGYKQVELPFIGPLAQKASAKLDQG